MSALGQQAMRGSRAAAMRPAAQLPAAPVPRTPRHSPARSAPRCAAAAPLQAAAAQRQPRRAAQPLRAQSAEAAVTAAAQPAAPGPLPPLPPLDGGLLAVASHSVSRGTYEAATAFSSYANWLLPGRLLLGRYPYVEPSRCTSYEQGEAQMEEIMQAGPRTFVSLQAELPPQAELKIGGKDGFMPYKSAAELVAASLTPPPPMEVINGLRNPTLDQFLPKRKKAAAPEVQDYYAREVVSFVHCPIVDLGVPTMQQLSDIVADLQRRLEGGESIYLHCWGGRGRAGTVGAAFLVAAYGLGVEEALARVQRSFDTRRDNKDRSPETDEQMQLVRDFAAACARK